VVELKTGIIDLGERYDSFQSEAVNNIVSDYKANAAGRYLLVIPTGGGKTYTAVKAINALYRDGVLDSKTDRIVWSAHRQELITQATDAFCDFKRRSTEQSYHDNVQIMMISKVANYVKDNKDIRIVVIDEAHHAATSNTQYGPIFNYPRLGILGLTATPSRHDGEPLEFEKESYSIGFPDLIDKQIILSPEIRRVEGETFDSITDAGSSFDGLEALSTSGRNKKIIEHIKSDTEEYQKIIIYAGSVQHTKDLYEEIKKSTLVEFYESIDYIVGGDDRSGNENERKGFIERLKSYRRSIVVNHDVLAEGYDDPTVNTIIMARPCRSKLVYMQAVGRGVRIDPKNPAKKAYIVEVVDDLPNIRYRIDNRWLFSEISDSLEPQVCDVWYRSGKEFEEVMLRLFDSFSVDEEHRSVPIWNEKYRYSVLFFQYFAGDDLYKHIPIVLDNESRSAVSNWFNFLSQNMGAFVKRKVNPEQAMRMANYTQVPGLENQRSRSLIADTMEEAAKHVSEAQVSSRCISFVALRYKKRELPDELTQFIETMVNRDQVTRDVTSNSFADGSTLIRFPLPLAGYVGQILTGSEFGKLSHIVDGLFELKKSMGDSDHRAAVRDFLDNSVLPVDMIYRDALTQIVREDEQFYMGLE
jgi:superfamily II DNA or RNA helicase